MHLLHSLLRRWKLSGLSVGMTIVVAAGLMIPVLIGMTLLSQFREIQIEQELDADLNETVALLSNSLAVPVWNFNNKSIEQLVDAAMLDPHVVRLSVTDPSHALVFEAVRPERRIGKPMMRSHTLVLDSETAERTEVAGYLELEVDDGLRRKELERDRRTYMFILLAQFALSLGLILTALHLRVLKPLSKLAAFSNQLAMGKFDSPIHLHRRDEIGQLAQHMDDMRSALNSAFSEQRAILGNVYVGVIFVRNQTIQLANRHAEDLFACATGSLAGAPVRSLFQSDEQFHAVMERIAFKAATSNGLHDEDVHLQAAEQPAFWARLRCSSLDSAQTERGQIWVIEDISGRKAAEEEINKLAFYDLLTLLPNRRLLMDRLKRALVTSARTGKIGALFFIDLDAFKTLNDTLGHDTGDLLLQDVAQRLLTCVREGDTVARLGGDEFVLMLEGLSVTKDEVATHCEMVGEKILRTLNQPYALSGRDVRSTPSIGVTLFDGQQHQIDELLKQADLAMYQSKTAGRNTLRFFDAAMQAVVSERAAWESDLREAIQSDQFVLFYQPQILGEKRVIGAEALIRWQHPQRGMVSPAVFIPQAEETGLILALGAWVLETACKQLALWASGARTAHLSIAVNVSAKQVQQQDFVELVLGALERTGANPMLLKLELTESMLLSNVADTIGKMSALKSRGIGFSLDDFGTGYSSLSYLKRLPLDQLKIDQGFVRDVLIDPNDAAIAKMIIALAAGLGLTVIAEGVELEGQRDFLAQNGCHTCQGYLFSKPLPVADFVAFLHER